MNVKVFLRPPRPLIFIASHRPHTANSLRLEVRLDMDSPIAIHFLGSEYVEFAGEHDDLRHTWDENPQREWDFGVSDNFRSRRRREPQPKHNQRCCETDRDQTSSIFVHVKTSV